MPVGIPFLLVYRTSHPLKNAICMFRLKKVQRHLAGPILFAYVLIYAIGLIFSLALLLGIEF